MWSFNQSFENRPVFFITQRSFSFSSTKYKKMYWEPTFCTRKMTSRFFIVFRTRQVIFGWWTMADLSKFCLFLNEHNRYYVSSSCSATVTYFGVYKLWLFLRAWRAWRKKVSGALATLAWRTTLIKCLKTQDFLNYFTQTKGEKIRNSDLWTVELLNLVVIVYIRSTTSIHAKVELILIFWE